MMLAKLIPETFCTVQEELLLLGGSVLLGIPSGIFFDFLRLFRRIVPHHAFTVMLEDIFFLLVTSFLLLCYVSTFAGGIFRMYLVIGWLSGFLLYIGTVGNFILHLLERFARICGKIKAFFVKYPKK
ncbi:MAG: spore cortex biosynthesis protein YabQ [Oscillospiraceae bacterium]|nr:spore cortex biosynthesis protein YabQ [Oscillospiraceae bacterium]MBR7084774.1 spore cortex biosynthesis protein YabQ [Oscillospiraceae bacterium]